MDRKLIAEALLEIAKERSETTFVEIAEKDKELINAAKKIGIVLPSPDIAIMKTVYAEIDKVNRNGVILPRKAVEQGLPTLIGKQVNWEHNGAGRICGYIIGASINGNLIETISVIFKSLFSEEMEVVKERFKKRELAVSFEIWNKDENGESVVKILENGTRIIDPILFHGQGLLLSSQPACPKAKVFKLLATTKEIINAEEIVDKVFEQDLIFASLALEDKEESAYDCECLKCGKIISSEKHCKDIKCPECGGEMRRKDRPGKGQPTEKSNEVKVEIKKIESKIWICPHCDKEIGEKELFYDEKNQKWYHRPCQDKGEIILPKDKIKEDSEMELYELLIGEQALELTEEEIVSFENDYEEIEIEEAKKLKYEERQKLSDDDFAVVITVKNKVTGEPRKIRMFPIHDEAHVRNALARLGQDKVKETLRKLGVSVNEVQEKILKRAKQLNMQDLLDKYAKSEEEQVVKEVEGAEETKVEKTEETKTEQVAETKAEAQTVETKGTEAQVAEQPAEPKKLVKIVTTETVTITESLGKDGESKVERKGKRMVTRYFSDNSEEKFEEEYEVIDTYTYAQVEEKVNATLEEIYAAMPKEVSDCVKSKIKDGKKPTEAVKECWDDYKQKAMEANAAIVTEKDKEISDLKQKLEKATVTQEPEKEKEKPTLDVGEVNDKPKDRAKEIRDGVDKHAFKRDNK